MNLYEIDSAILDCVDMETGEIVDLERLDQLQMDKDRKIENIACWIKDLRAEAKAIETERKTLLARQNTSENRADRLHDYLYSFLAGEKFKTARVSITYRKSEPVVIDDVSTLPKDYLVIKDQEPSKTKSKEAIKAGLMVPGAHIELKQNMQIK